MKTSHKRLLEWVSEIEAMCQPDQVQWCNGSKEEFVNDRKLSQRGVVGEKWRGTAGIGKHCAAFPVGLPLWAMSVYSHKGDLVLDPFGGSGTTGIACIESGRRFILIEKDAEYCEYALKRLKLASQANATTPPE